MSYHDAMRRYGSDKPDTRFGVEIEDFTDDLKGCGFKVFADVAAKGGVIRGINAPGGGKFSRADIEELAKFVGEYGARGLAWMKVTEAGLESSITKFFSPRILELIAKKLNGRPGDILLFTAWPTWPPWSRRASAPCA